MSFEIRVDNREVLANLGKLRACFRDAVAEVSPVFGGFMPYSYYAERGNLHFPPQPAIEPAISRNSQWITDSVSRRLFPALDRAIHGGGTASLKDDLVQIWESVLNDKPRAEARAAARYRTGAHRASIAGYARADSVEKALAEGERQQAMQRLHRFSL